VIEKHDFHELHPQEDLESSFDHPFQPIEESEESFNGEKLLELEIEEFLTCILSDLVCIQETNHRKEDDLHGMIEGDM